MPLLPITFIPIDEYTTYRGEMAVTEGDLVFHFFPTAEVQAMANAKKYWLETFAEVLERVAKEHFKAEYPRLKAAYTEEQVSWWLRAYGFGMLLEAHKFGYKFLDELDRALDAALAGASAKAT